MYVRDYITRARFLPAAERASRPWKNGGGETADVVLEPADATLDDFDWRISIAKVEASGPFSNFPGIDRTMAILSGAGLRLAMDGRSPIELTPESQPYAFPADVETEATLLGGVVTDLNVMTRRGRASAALQRLRLSPGEANTLQLKPALLLWVEGEGIVEVAGLPAAPKPLDAMHCDAPARWRLRSETGALVYLVEISG